jgi:signal transduction histidine kinase
MRITTRMMLTVTLLALVVLGGYGVYVARRSQDELEDTVARKTRLIAQGLTASIEQDARAHAWHHVQDTLNRLESDAFFVRVVDAEGTVTAETIDAPPLDPEERTLAEAALRGSSTFLVQRDGDPLRAVYAAALLDHGDRPIGALVVTQPLVGLSRTISETRRDAAIAVAAFVLAAAAAASWTGRVHVAAPIARLVAAMRRVRTGDLQPFGGNERTTEIRELGREFDAMIEQLDAARRRLVHEQMQRSELELHLRGADKLISIGHLAAGVAHEVGSPLQVLVGRARALATREYDAAAVRRQAEIIAEQGERIAAIVERLLGYTRRHPERPVATDMGEAVASIVDLLAPEARRRGIELAFVCAPDLPVVLATPGALQQIALNLALNALDATSRGGVVAVDVRAGEEAPPQVELVVSDTGRGIPESDRTHVFDAFFTTRAEQGGTGLGLAVVRSIVTEHGGAVELESETGVGTRVRVRLPVGASADIVTFAREAE